MKKTILVLLLVLVFGSQAKAHILLTTPYTVSGPGITTINATEAVATGKSFDRTQNIATITFSLATVVVSSGLDQSYTVIPNTPTWTLSLNLTTGFWQATSSVGSFNVSGTLTGAALTNANSTFTGPNLALFDAAEQFAAGQFLYGTQPNLWQAGDL